MLCETCAKFSSGAEWNGYDEPPPLWMIACADKHVLDQFNFCRQKKCKYYKKKGSEE